MASHGGKADDEQSREILNDHVPPTNNKRNAFSELMSSKPKQPKPPQQFKHVGKLSNPNDPRGGLLPYILNPAKFSSEIMIAHNDNTVLIRDAFPKAAVHLLLLPRDPDKMDLNPPRCIRR